jgi:hypothetical protein
MTNKNLFIILFAIFLVSCVKETISDLTKNKILLAGTGGVMSTYRVWKLDSAIKNNQALKLTTQQKLFKKKYFFNNTYTDTDLNEGIWDMISTNKLRQVIFLNNTKDTVEYDLISINSINLILKESDKTNNIIYFFSISK